MNDDCFDTSAYFMKQNSPKHYQADPISLSDL